MKPFVYDVNVDLMVKMRGDDHHGPITAIKWSPTSSILTTCSLDKNVSIWTVEDEI